MFALSAVVRKTMLIGSMVLMACTVSFADFLYTIPILDPVAIKQLADDQLVSTYVDVEIEYTALEAFHQRAGFSNANDFSKFKDVLRYRYNLLEELRKRKIEPPKINP